MKERKMTNFSKVWDKIIMFVQAEDCPAHPAKYILNIDVEDEFAMLSPDVSRLGGKLVSDITVNGVRATFPSIFGVPVTWGAKKTVLARVLDGHVVAG
jgi:hypothetical protein